jgi:hypothetical protein
MDFKYRGSCLPAKLHFGEISENSPPGSTNFTMEQLINITITQGKFHQYMGFVRLQASNEVK